VPFFETRSIPDTVETLFAYEQSCRWRVSPELLKQLLCNNFLAIVSCFALLSAKTSISRELAAPRAKETI
jgi:hypothetical protein